MKACNSPLTKDITYERNKPKTRSKSFLKAWSSKSKLVRFASQLRRNSRIENAPSLDLETEEKVVVKRRLNRDRTCGTDEDHLRKALFRRSLEAKLEIEHQVSAATCTCNPVFRRSVSEETPLTETKRSISNCSIPGSLRQEEFQRRKYVACTTPKPRRPPVKPIARSTSLKSYTLPSQRRFKVFEQRSLIS